MKLKQFISDWFERMEYGGYTIEEMAQAAGGGGKSGGGATQAPPPVPELMNMSVGNKLDATSATYSAQEEENKRSAVNKKTLGTRGLQIPMTASESTTATNSATTTSTPSTTGIQL